MARVIFIDPQMYIKDAVEISEPSEEIIDGLSSRTLIEAHARYHQGMTRDPAIILESMEEAAGAIWDNNLSIMISRDAFISQYVEQRIDLL